MSQSNTLVNEELTIRINDLGAELSSIKDNNTATEYLWNADEKYWKRHSPVLFPIVGSLRKNEYKDNNNIFSMSQHGFARDKFMNLKEKNESEIWYQLSSDEDTMKSYPFPFLLEIGYRLEGRKIKVMWNVKNEGQEKMYFQIGAHPAFLCPLSGEENKTQYAIHFHTNQELHYSLLTKDGLLERKLYDLPAKNGILNLTNELFDNDALIFEKPETNSISLINADREPYVTVNFDAPVVGLWSPAKKDAPFVCIEPWYGRCDASDFEGNIEDREWMYCLDKNEIFETSYEIVIGK